MTYEFLKVNVENRVATVTINNPPANALNSRVLKEIGSLMDELRDNREVKAIIITGEGKMFIAGADIKEIAEIPDAQGGQALSELGQRVFDKIETFPKPVIAALNGACLGGGMELAMSCHIRVASENVKLGQPEINLGLVPGFAATQRLARLTNVAIAAEMMLTGEMITAAEAHRLGVVNKVVPAGEVVDYAQQMAGKMAMKGSLALAYTIKTVFEGNAKPYAEGQALEAKLFGELFESDDKREGVSAFIEKRQAQFKD